MEKITNINEKKQDSTSERAPKFAFRSCGFRFRLTLTPPSGLQLALTTLPPWRDPNRVLPYAVYVTMASLLFPTNSPLNFIREQFRFNRKHLHQHRTRSVLLFSCTLFEICMISKTLTRCLKNNNFGVPPPTGRWNH